MDNWLDHEAPLRLGIFLLVFLLMAAWESLLPRRTQAHKGQRWLNNLGLVLVNSLILRLVFPAAGVGFALWVEGRGWGLPPRLDACLRWWVVTPDMHRVHHSWYREETDSNYGFNLPWWDRLFGTYCAQPRDGHEAMTIGLENFREENDQRLDRMLWQPWR